MLATHTHAILTVIVLDVNSLSECIILRAVYMHDMVCVLRVLFIHCIES